MKRSLAGPLIILAFLRLSAGAAAQAPASGSELRVKVVSADGPVIGAQVSLKGEGAPDRQAYTDESGECEFAALPAAAYSLKVHKRSFFAEPESERQAESFSLDGRQVRSVRVTLTRGGSIAGRLLDADGDPLTGVPVTAFRLNPASKKTALPPASESNVTSVPDDRGAFRLYGLRPGLYLLAFNVQREFSERKAVPPAYYPAQTESASAAHIYVAAAHEVTVPEIRIGVAGAPPPTVSGKASAGGAPARGVLVSIVGVSDESLNDSSLTDDEGRFGFEGIPPGRYRVRARPRDESYAEAEREVVVTDAGAEVALALEEYPAVEGVAYLSGESGREPLPGLTLRLAPAGAGARAFDFSTGSGGKFSFRASRGGLFWWRAPGLSRDLYLERIELSGGDVTGEPFRLSRKVGLRGVAVYVSAGAASIEGRLAEGDGCEGFAVYLAPAAAKGARKPLDVRRAGACKDGAFSFHSLAPGKYYLAALPSAGLDGPEAVETHRRAFGAAVEDSRLGPRDIITLAKGQKSAGHTPVRLSAK